MADPNLANYPGSVEIEYVKHVNEGNEQDITFLVKEINIHSSFNITSSFCIISIDDKSAWMEKIGFAPGDTIVFSLKHGELGSYEYRYRLKSIESIANLENGLIYSLKCISAIEYDSYFKRISRTYEGKPSDIFTAFVKNHFKESTKTIESSSQNIYFISPGWSPIQIVNHLARHSSINEGTSRMICYQDSKQFWNFTSMPGLQKAQKEEIITYRYFASYEIEDLDTQLTSIRGLTYYDSFNVKNELERGQVKNTFIDFDPNTKTAKMQQNSYHDTYKRNNLNEKKVWKEDDYGDGKFVYRNVPSSLGSHRYTPDDASNDQFEFPRAQQIEIIVYGNPVIDLGNVVNIEIPKMEPVSNQKIELDNVWSGLYYVVAKRDSIKKDGHMMVLRLAKDSFRRDR